MAIKIPDSWPRIRLRTAALFVTTALAAGLVTVGVAGPASALGPGKVCMFDAPDAVAPLGVGHVAWAYDVPGETASDGTELWVWGSYGASAWDSTRPWRGVGSGATMLAQFRNPPGAAVYTQFRCKSTATSAVTKANNQVTGQYGQGYNLAWHNCLTVAVVIFNAYDGALGLPSGTWTDPDYYFYNILPNHKWGPVHSL